MEEGTRGGSRYLGMVGAWALAFGCSVGWGSFVMPGTTFLPLAGPLGSAWGIVLGALMMAPIAVNYHFLMARYPSGGGAYTYTRESFGHDHAFLNAWFLMLTCIAIIWANATALPLIARTLFGDLFKFGHLYDIAGFPIYLGEILIAVGALLLGAFLCLDRQRGARSQAVLAIVMLVGIVICFAAANVTPSSVAPYQPPFSPDQGALPGTITILALAPWAYVGFESISHSSAEAAYPARRNIWILLVALLCAAVAYSMLALLATTHVPAQFSSWYDYVSHLDSLTGVESQPTFNAAHAALGTAGSTVLGLAALGAIFTGLVGNYIALSRLLRTLACDGMMPAWIGKLDRDGVPRHAVLVVLAVSVPMPLLGRTAISWIVDVTTVGATIAYAFTSACALKIARNEHNHLHLAFGIAGVTISVLFALEFLIPNLTLVKTLSTESYLILAIWGVLGFIYFFGVLHLDKKHRMGRSIVAWVVLLALIIFTSSVWTRQAAKNAINEAYATLEVASGNVYGAAELSEADRLACVRDMEGALRGVDHTVLSSIIAQVVMICLALVFLLLIYGHMQRRERRVEIEKALAEEQSRQKTSFLSNMSHEIRTPMNAIIGLDSIALRDETTPPQTREYLLKIGASAKHLLGLINDILDMSRIESGRVVIKDEEFSLREFLDQVNIIINGQCQDKGLNYDCVIIGDVRDYYVGDDMKLKQVLINILGNAVKFTESGGDVTLKVEQTQVGDETCMVRFTMSDTGIGMDEAYIPKIFEAFSQEDATAANRYGSTGLGMAITKNYVEMMGGTIEVYSQKGIGSTFVVTVRLGSSDRRMTDASSFVLPEGLRTLVVDDDEISAEHAAVVLHTLGIDCEVVHDPCEALALMEGEFLRGRGYNLLLTDYKMPLMSGLDLARAVRAFDGNSTVILILTGYSFDNLSLADVTDGVVAKPLFADTLVKELHVALSAHVEGGISLVDESAPSEDYDYEGVLEGCRVLMAEDVEQNAEILEDLLDLEGIEADHAENGQVAVDMFCESDLGYYDAILMDVRMPVMDGLTATEAIRALPRDDAREIPIIAMTANVFDEDMERSMRAGMNAHLAKPVEPESLYETMARLIAARRGLG